MPALHTELERLGRGDVLIVVGGVVPPGEVPDVIAAGAVAVFGPGTDEAPRDAVYSVVLDEGARMDGTTWVGTRGLFGAGFALWPDEEVELELTLATASTLRFVPVLRGTKGPEPTVLRNRKKLRGSCYRND